mgnify:CR=1 FL=1
MKKSWILLTACAALLSGVEAIACTGLLVGKKASTDGSVMISYAADSHSLYGEMYRWPAATWPKGAMLEVKEWDTGKPLGKIAQVEKTYSVVGNMNEHQVAITESTFGGRHELVDTTGIMDYGSLIYIALQRSKSAREAIKVMTDLVKEYGYYSSGETFSIADKNEAWVMEMIGKGPGNKGAVWVAIRIPDDCISAHANQSRIQQIPFDDKENCMYSTDVVSFAREKGYFKGKDADFSFAKAYCPYDFSALRGCEARVWSFFRKYDTTMDQYMDFIKGDPSKEPMPLYVKPNRKLSVQDVQNGMRDHYEGTPMDMTADIGAGGSACPYRWRPMTFKVDDVEYTNERAIATQQTGFSFVAQLRDNVPDAMKGVLWFGVDDANTCVYVPIYCCVTKVPYCYAHGNGDMLTLSWDAAFWVHNYVANQAYNRYSQMIPDIRRVQNGLEDSIASAVKVVEAEVMTLPDVRQREELSNFSDFWANHSTKEFKKLGDYLLVKYIDGNIKRETEPGVFKRTPEGMCASPEYGGYSEDYYRTVAKDAGERLKVIDIKAGK